MEMTWEQKLEACKSISQTHLEMRSPGDWFVAQYDLAVKRGIGLEGRYGNGRTPEEAVNDHWNQLTQLERGEYLVFHGGLREKRRAFLWNGFMWGEVKEDFTDASSHNQTG